MSILDEIQVERRRQDDRWGGPDHDDAHSVGDWQTYIHEHTVKALLAPPGSLEQRQRIIQVAALGFAVSACLDREHVRSGVGHGHGRMRDQGGQES
jgi:alpha-galactosidase